MTRGPKINQRRKPIGSNAKDGSRPDTAMTNIARTQTIVQVSESAMVEHAMEFLHARSKRGVRQFPSDVDIVRDLQATYAIPLGKAVAILRGMRFQIAERVNAVMPTFAQNVINDLHEEVQAARAKGDHNAAIRGLIGLGRFVGLDQPQQTPEQQVRQLSDAALDAAVDAAVARKMETMSEDSFADLQRRREAKRLADAKKADPPIIDASSHEATG